MNNIQIPTKVQKSVKGFSKCEIIGEYVRVSLGNGKYTQGKIQHISKLGVYCDNDEFYSWEMF